MSEININKIESKPWYKNKWVIPLAIIASPLLVPIILAIAPLLLFLAWRKKEWQTWVKGLITVIPSMWTLLLLFAVIAVVVEDSEKRERIEGYFMQANTAIESHDLTSAKGILEELIQFAPSESSEANGLLNEVKKASSSGHVMETLKHMSDEDFELLKSGNLERKYFTNGPLNTMFIEELNENLLSREALVRALADEKKQEERREKAAAEKARAQKEIDDRKEKIESQFSAWDGSHRNLTVVIKDWMNDPKSYSHDETVYWDMGDHLVVLTTFRGKNAFGGVVKNSIKAKVSLDGDVLEIIEQL